MTQTAFQAALAAFQANGGDVEKLGSMFASPIGQDRLIRKEVSLGAIREIPPPQEHIGLQFAPFMDVASDDVVFDYVSVDTDGLAPARAEDAESELAQKDDYAVGGGRAHIMDWAQKDHYDASDVSRYRDYLSMIEELRGGNIPLFIQSGANDLAGRFARDDAKRKRRLDNRIELLIMGSLSDGTTAYDDGKIKYAVDFGRPTTQRAAHADNDKAFGVGATVTNGVWDISGQDFDPLLFFQSVSQFMYDTYGVHMKRVIGSRKVLNSFYRSTKFIQLSGLGGTWNSAGQTAPDPKYITAGAWNSNAAREWLQAAADIQFVEYDSVYRTRPLGSTTVTSTRFTPQNRLIFLPDEQDLAQFDDTDIGFAKTLTSPHPEANWQTGFYEWERATVDPWGQDRGSGIKAFPVFMHMDKTFAVDVTLPA